MKEVNNKKKFSKKRKNGIWFSNSSTIDDFAVRNADKLQKKIEDIIFYGITIPIQLIQTIGVVVIAYFNDAFAELSFFLIGFFFTRSILGETYHLNSTVMCTTFTWMMFYIVTALIPSVYVSVFLCIVLGCLLSAYMNYVVTRENEKCPKD